MSEREGREQIVALAKGDRGERGEQGEQGDPLSPAVRRALIYLFTLSILIGVANLFWTSYAIRANNRDRCASVEQLAHIPIPQPVAGNPSREFAASLETIYRDRAQQLGCR